MLLQRLLIALSPLILLAAASTAQAQDTTVYVPHNPAGATASGNDLIAAVNGITGATSVRRFVVQLSGGIYDVGTQAVQLPSYVSLRGMGTRSTTVRGQGGSSGVDAVVEVASVQEVQVSQLRIISNGSGFTHAAGLRVLQSQGVRLKNLNVTATSASFINDGILVQGSTNVALEHVAASGVNGAGGGLGIAIELGSVNVDLRDVTASGLDNAQNNEGILVINATASIRDSVATARGGTNDTVGIQVRGGYLSGATVLPVTLDNVEILATGGADNIALELDDSSLTLGEPDVVVRNSSLVAAGSSGRGVFLDFNALPNGIARLSVERSGIQGNQTTIANEYASSVVNIISSTLSGGAVTGSFAANVECAATVDENLVFQSTGCP